MILVGELTPGARTTQDELARLLGVSTMPVREALLRLAAEGFVEASPSRSFTVVRTTPDDVRDIYWMHATLAGELTSRACMHADPELLDTLRVLHERGRAAQRNRDTAAAESANWAFHREINRAARSPKLSLMLRGSLRFIPEGFYGLLPEWSTASEDGHNEILAALESGDPEAARAAAQAHVQEAGALLASYFSHRGHWTRPSWDGRHDSATDRADDNG
jgi:DNA-binding GntR family transcriptional regulator